MEKLFSPVLRNRAILPRFRFRVPKFYLRFRFLPFFKVFLSIKTPAGYLDFCFISRQLHACVGQCPVRVDLVWYFLCNRNRNRNLEQGYGSGSGSSWVKIIRFRLFRFRNTASRIGRAVWEVQAGWHWAQDIPTIRTDPLLYTVGVTLGQRLKPTEL